MLSTRILTSLLVLVLGFSLAAQDKPVSPASQLSGSVDVEASAGNLLNSTYVAGIPGFSASDANSSVSLIFSDGVSRSYLDITQTDLDIGRSTRMGYEAGVTFDLGTPPSSSSSAPTYSTDGDASNYEVIQPMIDWYESNWRRFGMASSPYPDGVWPTDIYSGSAGRTRFIFGTTVEPIGFIAWDYNKWNNAYLLANEIKSKIEKAIDDISLDASGGMIVDQYAFAQLPESKRELALREAKAWDGFDTVVHGAAADSAQSGPTLKSAYIRFTNIGGLLDARLDFIGAKVSNGTLIPSPRIDQPTTGLALGFALPVGLFPGFNLSTTASLVGGDSSVVEDYSTKDSEVLPGEVSWLGLKVQGGYSILNFADVKLSLLWPDLAARPMTLASTLNARVAQHGQIAYSAALEGSFLLWQDRYLTNPANVIAYSAGLDADTTAFGLTPSVLALYKSAGFWGEGGNDKEDRFPGADLQGDFNSAKVKDAVALDLGLAFDPAGFIDLDLVSIGGGYQMFLYDPAAATTGVLGQGWYANLAFKFLDLLKAPIGITAKASNYTNWGVNATSYTDWNKAPAPGLLSGIDWSASADWDPSKAISVSLEVSGADSGWRMDTQQVLSAGLKASVKF